MIGVFLSAIAVGYVVRDHLKTPYDGEFNLAESETGVDANLLRAIARYESGFRASVVNINRNGTTDYGIGQINETNLRTLGLTTVSALNPRRNLRAMADLLVVLKKELGDKFSTFTLISSYNLGSPTVKRSGILNQQYTSSVYWHLTLYTFGRMFA